MNTLVYGFYEENRDEREPAILAMARSRRLPAPDLTIPHYLDVFAEAIAQRRKKAAVYVIGHEADVGIDSFEDGDIWRSCAIHRLVQEGVVFHSVTPVTPPPASLQQKSFILRKTMEAQAVFNAEMQKRLANKADLAMLQNGRKGGRPAYGYQGEDGQLVIHPQQAEAVRLIYDMVRQGAVVQDVVTAVKTKFPGEFWDHVKLRRVLAKPRLYCLGEITTLSGHTITNSKLAFLPADWLTTTIKKGKTCLTAPTPVTS